MKKPSQKKINKYLENIESNFSELINGAISYEKNGMDDWATEIIGAIEHLPLEKELNLLLNDLKHRKKEDFTIYSYQRLWWGIINVKSDDTNKAIIDFCKKSENGEILSDNLNFWFNELDNDSESKVNIGKIVKFTNKLKS